VNGEDALTDWLVTTLEADATLMGMLNGDIAPEVTWNRNASPFVRIDRLDGEDLMVIGLYRVWVDTQYHVRGVFHWNGEGRPDREDVNAIGARIDELLHDHEAISSGWHFHSFREEPEPNPAVTEPNGELWLQSGGLYRIRVSAA
jgi:hypothetical protein